MDEASSTAFQFLQSSKVAQMYPATRHTLQQNRPAAIVMKILLFKINKGTFSCDAFDLFLRVLKMERVLTAWCTHHRMVNDRGW